MIKLIIYIIESPYTKRDHHRFGVEIFQNNGFQTQVWDLTHIFHPDYTLVPLDHFSFDGLTVFGSRAEVSKHISLLNPAEVLVINTSAGWLDKLWFFKMLKKYNLKHAMVALSIVPSSNKDSISPKKTINKLLSFRLSKISLYYGVIKNLIIKKCPFALLRISPAVFFFVSGENSFNYYCFPVNSTTKVVWLHALDYDRYLEENKKPISSGTLNKGVFLDAYMPYHPDFALLGETNPLKADEYYPNLCRFFERIENEQNTKIEIAAHPRSDYRDPPKYFGDRRVHLGKTIECVRSAKFVIAHSSTAINFAVLYRKPILFVFTEEMAKNGYSRVVDNFASSLGKKSINIDKPYNIDWDQSLLVNEEKYSSYQNSIIKKTGTKEGLSWQMVADVLRDYAKNIHDINAQNKQEMRT